MEKQLALARLGFERERGLYTEGRLEIMIPCVYPGHGHSVYASFPMQLFMCPFMFAMFPIQM